MPRSGQTGLELRRHAHPRHALSVRDRRGHDALRRRRADNASFSSTSFRPARRRSGRTASSATRSPIRRAAGSGKTSWSATKTMIPIDGEVRTNIGLLGSPSFEIPRSLNSQGRTGPVAQAVPPPADGQEPAQHRDDGDLPVRAAGSACTSTLLLGFTTVDLYQPYGIWASRRWRGRDRGVQLLLSVLVERASTGFRRLKPQFCSIYEPYFWWHERLLEAQHPAGFSTERRSRRDRWRLLGVPSAGAVRRRRLDEREDAGTLGDDCTLNAGVILQSHSMEDGVFKSDHIAVGSGVHARTRRSSTTGSRSAIVGCSRPDSFVMKGPRGVDPDPVAGQPGAGGRRRGTASRCACASHRRPLPGRNWIGSRT